MVIHLNEIPPEGLSADYDQSNRELQEALSDIISKEAFSTRFHILPIGDGYDVTGKVETQIPLQCARCTKEFKLPIKEKFHEILLIGSKNSRKFDDSSSHMSDPDIFVTEVGGNEYSISHLLHEIIGLAEPPQALCDENCKGLCQTCGIDLNSKSCDCVEKENVSSSPFSVLKDLKLN